MQLHVLVLRYLCMVLVDSDNAITREACIYKHKYKLNALLDKHV